MRKFIVMAAIAAACSFGAGPANAQQAPKDRKDRPSAFGNLGSNKEPIKIDADRLDVFDRESRAVFSGNVVAVQGESTMRCTTLTVHYEQARGGAARADGEAQPVATASAGQPAAGGQPPSGGRTSAPGPGGTDQAIKKIDCQGPVTIVSKTQVATGDNATFDRVGNRVLLTGNVALSDGPNVTRGERIVYDLNTGIANVETAPGGRVRALFVPGSGQAPGSQPSGGGQPPGGGQDGPAGSGSAAAKPKRQAQ